MAENRPEMPHTQTSAPVEPPGTTEDVAVPRRDEEAAPGSARRAGEEDEVRGDRMPAGADEPGAGM